MTSAEKFFAAIKEFQAEHGVDDLLILLNDTILATAQAAGMDIEYIEGDDDEDDGEWPAHTVQ